MLLLSWSSSRQSSFSYGLAGMSGSVPMWVSEFLSRKVSTNIRVDLKHQERYRVFPFLPDLLHSSWKSSQKIFSRVPYWSVCRILSAWVRIHSVDSVAGIMLHFLSVYVSFEIYVDEAVSCPYPVIDSVDHYWYLGFVNVFGYVIRWRWGMTLNWEIHDLLRTSDFPRVLDHEFHRSPSVVW